MRNYLTILAFVSLMSMQACKTPEYTEVETIGSAINETLAFKIELLDSIVVKDILVPSFAFQGKAGDNLVFRDKASPKVFVFDSKGKPLYSWDKSGDVPGNFSMVADNFVFDKSGNIILSDNIAGVRSFSPDGNLLFQNRTFQPQTGFHLIVDLFRKNQLINKGGKEFLIHHLDLMDDVQQVSQEFYENRKNLLLTDLSNGKTKPFLPFPDKSKFLSGKAFPFEDFRPVFFFDEKEEILYLMFQNEPILYLFEWKGEEPVFQEMFKINLPGFSSHDGWQYKEVDYGLLNARQLGSPFPSRIRNLEKFGNDFLISYNPSPANESDLEKVRNNEASKELKDKLKEETRTRIILLEMKTKNSSFLDSPPMRYDSFILIEGQIWWMKPSSKEVEDEDFIIYWGRISENK